MVYKPAFNTIIQHSNEKEAHWFQALWFYNLKIYMTFIAIYNNIFIYKIRRLYQIISKVLFNPNILLLQDSNVEWEHITLSAL